MVSAGNVATAGIFTLLAVLLVLQATRDPKTAAPEARPSAVAAADGAASTLPMRAVILPPPPGFRGTPRAQAPAQAQAPAAAAKPPLASVIEPPKPRPPATAPGPAASAPSARLEPAPSPAPPPAITPPPPPPPPAAAATPAPPPPKVTAAPPPPPPPPPPPATAASAGTIRVDPADASGAVGQGRILLRLLELGRGPAIEIAWPTNEAGHDALYRLMVQCYGMRVALLDQSGRLLGGAAGASEGPAIDLDRFSGFVREPKGFIPPEEARQAAALRQRYAAAGPLRAVRVFPRQVDAALIGGLHQLLGDRYDAAASISAAYRRSGQELAVEDVAADGVAVPGRIMLVPSREEPCGQGS